MLTQDERRAKVRAVFKVASCNFIEAYDFIIYGYYANYIAATFFPAGTEFASLMNALVVYGAGFLMRPLGAIFLGAYMDRKGRKQGLILTLGLMALGTLSIAITPGYLRSESMLQRFGVTEANWRDQGKKDKNFLESETPLFVGRAVAALAADPAIMKRTGQLLSSWEVAREFNLTDADGRRPDWGAHVIDFSRHPQALLDRLRVGSEIQIGWLGRLQKRTKQFARKLPPKKRSG